MVILVEIIIIFVIWMIICLIKVYSNILVIFRNIIGIKRIFCVSLRIKYGRIEVIKEKGIEVEIKIIGVGINVFFKMFWDVEILIEKKICRMKLNMLKIYVWIGCFFFLEENFFFLFVWLFWRFVEDEFYVFVLKFIVEIFYGSC